MDQTTVLNSICKDELGLGIVSTGQLQSGVKRWIDAWNLFAVPGERFNELTDATVKAYAGRYLDQGWDRDERVKKGAEKGVNVPPGKKLWMADHGLKHSKYEYPKDTEAILGGIEKIFHIMRGNGQVGDPVVGYPTPTSARKRKSSNNGSNDTSSHSDSTDEADSPLVWAQQRRTARVPDLSINKAFDPTDLPVGKNTVNPFLISDHESLPGGAREGFNSNQPNREKGRNSVVKGAKQQNAKAPGSTGNPTKERRAAGRSIVRSSNNIKAKKGPNGRRPPNIPDTEEGRLETTLLPLSTETQMREGRTDDNAQSAVAVPSVEDSVGSQTPRETLRAFSLDLGAPPSVGLNRPAEPRSATFTQGDHPMSPCRSTKSDVAEIHAYPPSPIGSSFSVNFWILTSNKPHNKWYHWADANLHLETVDSVFDIIGKLTGHYDSNTADVQLRTTREEYAFQIQRDHYSRFEAMRAFMLQTIDANQHDTGCRYSSINIYLRSNTDLVSSNNIP